MSILQEALRRKHEDAGVPPAGRLPPPPLPPARGRTGLLGPLLFLAALALTGWIAKSLLARRGESPPAPAMSESAAPVPPPSPAAAGPVHQAREAVAAARRLREELPAEAPVVPPPAPPPAPVVPAIAAAVPASPPAAPPPTAPATAPAVPPLPAASAVAWPDLRIKGILAGPGGSPTVMIESLGMFECGDTLPGTDGLVIDSIRPDGLTLRKGDATRAYRMGKR